MNDEMKQLKKREKKLLKQINRAEIKSSILAFFCQARSFTDWEGCRGRRLNQDKQFSILGLLAGAFTIASFWGMLISVIPFAIAGVAGIALTIFTNYSLPEILADFDFKSKRTLKKLAKKQNELNYIQERIEELTTGKRTKRDNFYEKVLTKPENRSIRETNKNFKKACANLIDRARGYQSKQENRDLSEIQSQPAKLIKNVEDVPSCLKANKKAESEPTINNYGEEELHEV